MTRNIGYYDARILLSALADIGLAVLIGLALYRLNQLKPFAKTTRVLIALLFCGWAIAALLVTTIDVYNYFNEQRDFLKQSIELQQKAELGI